MKRIALIIILVLIPVLSFAQATRVSLQDGTGNELGTSDNPLKVQCIGDGCGSGSSDEWENDGTYVYPKDQYTRVGIGTFDPQYKLHVIGTFDAATITQNGVAPCLSDGSNCPSESPTGWTRTGTDVYLTNTGDNVGIGTINPQGKLHVANGPLVVDGTFSGLYLNANGMKIDGDTSRKMTFSQTNGTYDSNLRLDLDTTEGVASIDSTSTTPIDTLQLVDIDFTTNGDVTATAFHGDGSALTGIVTTSSGWTDGGTNVYTTSTTDNVGIGTTTPLAQLEVQTANIGDTALFTRTTASTNTALTALRAHSKTTGDAATDFGSLIGFTFSDTGVTEQMVAGIAGVRGPSADTEGELSFRTGSSLGERMRIVNSGNVGLGTFSPQAKLEVTKEFGNPNFMISSTATAHGDYLLVSSAGRVGIGTTLTPVGGGMAIMNGNVGIGTWVPAQALDVKGTVAATAFSGDGSALTGISGGSGGWTDGGTNVYTTSTTDNVGIGTTTPSTKLTVDGTVTATAFSGDGASVSNVNAITGDSATAFFSSGQIERARGGTGGDTSSFGNGLLGSNGSNVTIDVDTHSELETAIGGLNVIVSTEINTSSEVAGIVGDEVGSGFLVFSASPNFTGTVGMGTTLAVGGLSVMNGNVGVGTWSPTANVQVVGTVAATAFTGDGSALTGITGGTGGWTDGGTNVYVSSTTDSVGIGTTTPSTTLEIVKQGSNKPLMISSAATGDGDYLIIDSAGGVGIGSTSPQGTGAVDLGTKTLYVTSIAGASGGIQSFAGNVGIGTTTAGSLVAAGTTGQLTISSAGALATSSTVSVADDAYAAGWNGSTAVPTKNAVYDKIETLSGGSGGWTDGGNGVYTTTSTDKVGIGTTNPDYTLSIKAVDADVQIITTDTAEFGTVKFFSGSTPVGSFGCGGSGVAIPNECFFEQEVVGAPINFLNSTGAHLKIVGPNVGIGTVGSGGVIFVSPDGSCSKCGPNNSDVWACSSVSCL